MSLLCQGRAGIMACIWRAAVPTHFVSRSVCTAACSTAPLGLCQVVEVCRVALACWRVVDALGVLPHSAIWLEYSTHFVHRPRLAASWRQLTSNTDVHTSLHAPHGVSSKHASHAAVSSSQIEDTTQGKVFADLALCYRGLRAWEDCMPCGRYALDEAR